MIPWRAIYRCLSPQGEFARLSILIYHRVLAIQDPLLPDIPDRLDFERQMIFIRRYFNVLSLGEAVAALATRTLPERALCVTFDDGYADNFHVALPVLEKLGIPAAVFVATDFLDGGIMFNDVVIEIVRRSVGPVLDLSTFGLDLFDVSDTPRRRLAINTLIGKIKYLPSKERAKIAHDIQAYVGINLQHDFMMTRSQVREMLKRGITIGAHTMSHPILSNTDEVSAERELHGSKTELENIIGRSVDFFAYPNGKPGQDYLASHAKVVRDCGFTAAFTTAPGSVTGFDDPMQIPRYTPWERDNLRYGLRLAQNLLRTGAKVQ